MKRIRPVPPRAPRRLEREDALRARGNPRLASQTRKVLARHYAAKYRVR